MCTTQTPKNAKFFKDFPEIWAKWCFFFRQQWQEISGNWLFICKIFIFASFKLNAFESIFVLSFSNMKLIWMPHCPSVSQQSVRSHLSVLKYLPAGGPPVIVFPRCLNGKTLKDEADSLRDEGCYGRSKTDAHADGRLQALASGASDRRFIIAAILHL